jgi:hypothetical protein
MQLALGLVVVVAHVWSSAALRRLTPCNFSHWGSPRGQNDEEAGTMYFRLLRVMLRKEKWHSLEPVEIRELLDMPWVSKDASTSGVVPVWKSLKGRTKQETGAMKDDLKARVVEHLTDCGYDREDISRLDKTAWPWFEDLIEPSVNPEHQIKDKVGQLRWLIKNDFLTADDVRGVLADTAHEDILERVIHLLWEWRDAPHKLKLCTRLRFQSARKALDSALYPSNWKQDIRRTVEVEHRLQADTHETHTRDPNQKLITRMELRLRKMYGGKYIDQFTRKVPDTSVCDTKKQLSVTDKIKQHPLYDQVFG